MDSLDVIKSMRTKIQTRLDDQLEVVADLNTRMKERSSYDDFFELKSQKNAIEKEINFLYSLLYMIRRWTGERNL